MKRRDVLARYQRDMKRLVDLLTSKPEGMRIEAASGALGLTVARVHELAQDCPLIRVAVAVRSGSGVGRIKNVRDYILEVSR